MAKRFRGRIIEIKKNVHKVSYVLQGVRKEDQWKYDQRYPGKNGSYAAGHEYHGTTLDVKIRLFDEDKLLQIDIRDYVLQQNSKKKLSDKILKYVIKRNTRRKVYVEEGIEGFYFDRSQLDVVPPAANK